MHVHMPNIYHNMQRFSDVQLATTQGRTHPLNTIQDTGYDSHEYLAYQLMGGVWIVGHHQHSYSASKMQ